MSICLFAILINMQKLHFSIVINAPVEKVWDTMLNLETYKVWTLPFNETGSSFDGDWSEGSKMYFLGPQEDGTVAGMVSEVRINHQHEFISLKAIAELKNGKEVSNEESHVQDWFGALEEYTFNSVEGGTQVDVNVDIPAEYAEHMSTAWSQALAKLKEISEKN